MAKQRELPLILKRTSTKKLYTVKEVTEILERYGIVSNVRVVQRYIRNGDLKGIPPVNPNDKREGYRVSEATLYAFIVKRIPALSELWKMVSDNKK